jgi:DNA-binding IclR family transcriptional regulator
MAAAERMDLKGLCKPALLRMAADTGDTVFLIIRSGDESVCVDRAEGSYPVRTYVVDIGTRRPLGVGAASLAILSALSEADAQAVIARNASRLPAFNGMTAARLQQMMMQAREAGHVAMDVIDVQGVRAVAVPIVTRSGKAVAALSIAAVEWRMTPQREAELLARLKDEATAIGAHLGVAPGREHARDMD